jgi:hypothetical protein
MRTAADSAGYDPAALDELVAAGAARDLEVNRERGQIPT